MTLTRQAQRVIITGASSGIGGALALRSARAELAAQLAMPNRVYDRLFPRAPHKLQVSSH